MKVVERSLFKEGILRSDLAAQCVGMKTTSTTEKDAEFPEDPSVRPVQSQGKDADSPLASPTEPFRLRRNIMEIILDPRSIQCLLGLRGAMMVVGLVILLWINNYFTQRQE